MHETRFQMCNLSIDPLRLLYSVQVTSMRMFRLRIRLNHSSRMSQTLIMLHQSMIPIRGIYLSVLGLCCYYLTMMQFLHLQMSSYTIISLARHLTAQRLLLLCQQTCSNALQDMIHHSGHQVYQMHYHSKTSMHLRSR